MAWKDQLQPASYRGIVFDVVNDQGQFGRRSTLHEYPFRDIPVSEDLGRRAREFRISAILLGQDYMQRRDALIEAVENEGGGKLVHPQYGEMQVSVTTEGMTVEHSTAEGGCCRIYFSCVETGEFKFPSATVVTEDVVRDRADDAADASGQSFLDRFSFDGLPGWLQGDAIAQAQSFLDQAREVVDTVGGIGSATGLIGIISNLSPGLSTLLRDGMGLANQVRGIFSRLRSSTTPAVASRVLASFGTFGAQGAPAASTPLRTVGVENHAAITELVRGLAVIEEALAVADRTFPSFEDAIAVRDGLVERIDQVADTTPSDALYGALVALRAAVVTDITVRGADLSRVVTLTPTRTLPALVLAYQIHGDSSRDSEIIERNGIAHPGYVPGGIALEVFSE